MSQQINKILETLRLYIDYPDVRRLFVRRTLQDRQQSNREEKMGEVTGTLVSLDTSNSLRMALGRAESAYLTPIAISNPAGVVSKLFAAIPALFTVPTRQITNTRSFLSEFRAVRTYQGYPACPPDS